MSTLKFLIFQEEENQTLQEKVKCLEDEIRRVKDQLILDCIRLVRQA